MDEVYQLAADMGGAGFVFTGEKINVMPCGNCFEFNDWMNPRCVIF